MAVPQLRFLGTGTAFQDDGRAAAGLLLERAGAAPVLIDIGPTVVVALTRAGLDVSGIDRLFVTHLHGDHVAGWPFLLLHRAFRGAGAPPLHVHGPRGTRECLEGLTRLCYAELAEAERVPVEFHELGAEEAQGLAAGPGLAFDVVPMRHHPSSLGYRLHLDAAHGRRVLAITGDTGWCDGLERLAAGADLLVAECSELEPRAHPHLSLREIRNGRERLAARRIALVHLTDAVAEALALDPIARVLAAYDGMVLPLVADDSAAPSAD